VRVKGCLPPSDTEQVFDSTRSEVGVRTRLGDAVDVGVDDLVVETDEPCDCEGLMAGNGVGPCDVVDDSFADLC
jgi:hypothetical protein